MNTPILVRDTNGKTLGRFELDTLVDESLPIEAHVSDSGTLIVTVSRNDDYYAALDES